METIEIVITKKHFDGTYGFMNEKHCPLANAMKEALDKNNIGVGVINIWEYYDEDSVLKLVGSIRPAFDYSNFEMLRDGKITEFKTVYTPIRG